MTRQMSKQMTRQMTEQRAKDITKQTVYLGMSGGVDSSLSAVLLKEQGYNVVGVYMKNWSRDLPGMKCPWAEDLADAKRVAVRLGIDFKVFDFETDYKQKVVDYMLEEFKKGNTPNPDIICNQEIKFKLFYEVAMEQGADLIATGHYARVGRTKEAQNIANNSVATLLRAVDENKDQTYFLYRISDEVLSKTLFPVGGMMKTEVKAMAAEKGLDNAYKKESMGVCFVGEVGMKDFLKEYIDIQPGDIIDDETGKVVGVHEGAVFYTIGQRHGLKVGGGLPYYVVKKDVKKNLVYVSRNLNAVNLWKDKLELKDVIIRGGDDLAIHSSKSKNEVMVRLRHRAPLIPAKLITKGEAEAEVYFDQPIKAPAAGQSVVFYSGEACLGGGIIK